MKMYDLTIQFSDRTEPETRSFYNKKGAENTLKTVIKNEKNYNYSVLSHEITEREVTQEEINTWNKTQDIIKELDELEG